MAFSRSALVVILVACLLAYFIIAKVVSSIEGYRFARANGCKEPAKYPQSERIIGYANFKEQVAMSKAKMMLPTGLKRFREIGRNTYSIVSMGQKLVATIEPENIKAILATNFNDFGIGLRMRAFGPLLGQGIFTSDGAIWEHSRVSRFIYLYMTCCLPFLGPRPSKLHQAPSS